MEYLLRQNTTVLQIQYVNGNYVIMDQVHNYIYGKVSIERKVDKKLSYKNVYIYLLFCDNKKNRNRWKANLL